MDKLAFIGGLSWWMITLLVVVLGSLLVHQFFGLRQRLSRTQNAWLTFLRGLVYAVLILFVAGPVLVQERTTKLRHPLVLMVDTSESMGFAANLEGEPGKTRLELVKEKLLGGDQPLIERMTRDYDLRLYQFHTTSQPIARESLADLSAQGKGTRLVEALSQVRQKVSNAAGIILLSDGIANGSQELDGASSPPMPVFTVPVGETKGFVDLRIADLRIPEFAFRGREVKLDFSIEAYGLEGKKVPLYFARGQNLISTQTISIEKDPFRYQVSLSYTPREIGAHSFTLRLPTQRGEQIPQNNQRSFKIEVHRDKIRVLTLSGSPSWNYRFLRLALKEDPFVDLISFVFLRTPTDAVDVPENQLSLIPFPIDEILKEIQEFDLVLFDNFSHRAYFSATYLEAIRDFIKEGGGFAMLGGNRSFDNGDYWESPLAEALPVELDGTGSYETNDQLRASLAAAGRAHPVTRIFPDSRANEEAWKKLPPLTRLNQVAKSKGQVLLWASHDETSRGWPLLTVGKFGRGRTLALLSDDLWRWNFFAVGEKENSQVHQRLIRQAVRWLAQDSLFEQVRIISIGGSMRPGERLEVRVRVVNDDYTPAPRGNVKLLVKTPDGEPVPLGVVPDSAPGEYSAEFVPAREGSYSIEAEAELAGRTLGKDRKEFVVSVAHAEIEDGRPRAELLTKISKASQGGTVPITQWDADRLEGILAEVERRSPSEIVERQETPLWNLPWILAFMLLLLGVEWWQRRSWGLI